jgi:eukaryotic-like serine/threonine-protein kinase
MPSATAGLQLGPYILVAPLGSGSMGQVWKARDTRLYRTVAIKLLNNAHGRDFEREARAIAALNHPNICQIHDVGTDYLVLEYVEGKPPGRCESAEEALRLAIQIAAALETAHRQNVIHRDLKPANILVTAEGQVKLLDFGIAKLTNADGIDSTATLDGAVKGTPCYMSPEQAQGQPADARSDIFSFGVVCYELLSGRRAFTGESAVHVMGSIVRDNPEPLHGPPAFERIVMRCLEKSPAARFQTMTELKVALEQIALKPSSPRPSIAVLPFDNMSGDKDNEYFSDGLAEEIINALAQLPSLKVIARTSAFAFKGKQEDIRRIAETLGVDHVLEGSVRRAGQRIRVTAQLIAAADGSHLWSQRYDREWADVFAIQDDIAESIVDSLRLKLALEPAALRRHTPNLAAYEALLKARHDSLLYTPEAAERCRKNYEHAIALDPHFAQAYAELGIQFLTRALPGIAPARDTMPLARAAAEKALQLDSCLPEAEAVLAAVAGLYDYDWQESGRRFKLAMAREPVPPSVRFLHGMFFLCPMGLPQEAAAGHLRGLEEDPLSFGGRFQLAVVLFQAGRIAEAETQLRQTMQFHPNAFQLPMFLGLTNSAQGKLAEAVAWARQAFKMAPWHSHPPAILAGLLMQLGERSEAEMLLSKLPAPETYGIPTAMTFYHLLSGELDSAADWSEKAIEQRDPRLVLGLQLPMAGNFRAHPRGQATLRKMNLLSV